MNEQRKYEICIYCIYNGISISLKKDGNRTTCYIIAFVVQSLSRVRLFETPWTAAHQAFLSFTISWSCLKLISIESVMSSSHRIHCLPPLPLPSTFPESGSFPMNWLFALGGQSIGASASASVLPRNIQDWFPLRLTSLISLLSKGLSRVFSSTTVQKHQFFGAQSSLCPILTSVHGYWKNHSFNYTDLCQQSDI